MHRSIRKESGAALVVALLVMTIIAFLGGLLLLMAQGERRISSTFRQASVAFGNAEAGVETAFNQLPMLTRRECNPTIPTCANMSFYTGPRDGSAQDTIELGQQPPVPGYNIGSMQWDGYIVTATGTSRTFLVFVNQAITIQTHADIGHCAGTSYNCN